MRTAKQQARQQAEISALTSELKINQARENIEKYRKQLRLDIPNGVAGRQIALYHYTIWMGALAENYKTVGDIDNMKQCCLDIVQYVKAHSKDIPNLTEHHCRGVQSHYRNAHILLAPHFFHFYLLVMEWSFSGENTLYRNRYCVMKDWARRLQRLEDGDLMGLGISAPPTIWQNGHRHTVSYVGNRSAPGQKLFLCDAHKCNGRKGVSGYS